MEPDVKVTNGMTVFKLDAANVAAWRILVEAVIEPENDAPFFISAECGTVQNGEISRVRGIPVWIAGVTALHNDGTLKEIPTVRRKDDKLNAFVTEQLPSITAGLDQPDS